MSVNNFGTGDIVTVRSDLDENSKYGNIAINSTMANMGGQSFRVARVVVSPGTTYGGYYVTNDNEWCWNDEMLESFGFSPMKNDTVRENVKTLDGITTSKQDLIELYGEIK